MKFRMVNLWLFFHYWPLYEWIPELVSIISLEEAVTL